MKTKLQWFEQFKEEFLDGNGKYVNDETKHMPRFIEHIQLDVLEHSQKILSEALRSVIIDNQIIYAKTTKQH